MPQKARLQMTPERAGILPKLREIFADRLHLELPPEEADLISGGFVDSLALVELLLQIEREFGVTPDFESLEIEDFETLAAIEQLILRSAPAHTELGGLDAASAAER
ncbi:MAG: acyl carrier protein [Gaiellaceae bacterium]